MGNAPRTGFQGCSGRSGQVWRRWRSREQSDRTAGLGTRVGHEALHREAGAL